MNASSQSRQPRRDALLLGFCTGIVAAVWLVALPYVANLPRVDAHLEWLDARGIDPSAMYYTELEAMEPILTRLEHRRRSSR